MCCSVGKVDAAVTCEVNLFSSSKRVQDTRLGVAGSCAVRTGVFPGGTERHRPCPHTTLEQPAASQAL